MYEKRKIFLLVTTLIILFIGISAVSATNITDNQAQNSLTDNTIQSDDNSVLQTDSITSDNNIVKTQTTKKIETKSIEKEKSLKTTKKDNSTIKTEPTITVTDGTYRRYFIPEGTLDGISANSTIILSGTFNNKTFYLDKEGLTLIGNNATLNNGQIYILEDAPNTIVKNITIIGKDNDTSIQNEAENVTITNNNVSFVNSHIDDEYSVSEGIANTASNVIISNNVVDVKGHAQDISWNGDRAGLVTTLGILNWGGNNVLIENNTVIVSKINECNATNFSTIDGIEVREGDNITVNNNTVAVTGARFLYALNALNSLSNIVISNNKLQSEGNRYIDGIQIGDGAINCTILHNEITGKCHNTTIYTGTDEAMAFGIITTTSGSAGAPTMNMNVINNTINLNSGIVYGIEIYTTRDSTISGNSINGVGNYTMGMSLAHSSRINVTNNYINTTGNSTTPINNIDEEIRPANTGIQIQQKSENSTITNNTVYVIDAGNNARGICVNGTSNILVTNNTITSNNLTGDNAISIALADNETNITIVNNTAPIVKENNANIQLILPENPEVNTNITLTAHVTNRITNNPINGKLVFKINGITIKDSNKNPLKLNVTNGIAELNYSLIGYNGRNYTITAVFSNSSYNRAENTSNLNIQKVNVNFTPKNMTAHAGETILINETLHDKNGNRLYGNTKVAIKIDGKTIEHATIQNGVLTINITLPSGLRQGTHTITYVLGGNNRYTELRANNTITIQKQNAIINITPIITQAGNYITFNATILANNTHTPATSGTFVFKINGKTIINANEAGEILSRVQKVNNGTAIAHTYLDVDMRNGTYNMTLVYSGNNQINPIRVTVPYLTIRT